MSHLRRYFPNDFAPNFEAPDTVANDTVLTIRRVICVKRHSVISGTGRCEIVEQSMWRTPHALRMRSRTPAASWVNGSSVLRSDDLGACCDGAPSSREAAASSRLRAAEG
jgi:hypothetical protein